MVLLQSRNVTKILVDWRLFRYLVADKPMIIPNLFPLDHRGIKVLNILLRCVFLERDPTEAVF